ncbi:MAG: transglutaminase-like domain-containing protein [Promethearchaeota archaeon]
MSRKKNELIGGLTKGKIIRNVIIYSALVGILLTVWLSYPYLMNQLFGSRGGYDVHDDLPDDHNNYDLDRIEFNLSDFNIDPLKFNLSALPPDLLNDLFNNGDLDMNSDFSSFNNSNFNIPLFYYQDEPNYSDPYGASYQPNLKIMRQKVYDSLSDDGSTWSSSASAIPSTLGEPYIINEDFYHDHYASGYTPNLYVSIGENSRAIKFPISDLSSLNLKLPFFPYMPHYINSSLRVEFDGGGANGIPDSGNMYIDTYDAISIVDSSLNGSGNLTYNIFHDINMSLARINQIKNNSIAPSTFNNVAFNSYKTVPNGGLVNYLSGHSNFNKVYNVLSDLYSPSSDKASVIADGIRSYLLSNYDLFTQFPERPGTGEDMIEWFLARNNTAYPDASGTPYDFAAAFTMLARALNLPARLVTGFYDWDDDGVIQVMNIYAWSEVYLPNSSTEGDWVVYDFSSNYDSSSWHSQAPVSIQITTPTNASTVGVSDLNSIKFHTVISNPAPFTRIYYSFDGGYTQNEISADFKEGSPLNFTDSFISVPSTGHYHVQAFIEFPGNVVFNSSVVEFDVVMEEGYIDTFDEPASFVQKTTNLFNISYSVYNSSPITNAYFQLRDVYSPTDVFGPYYTSLNTSYNGSFMVPHAGRFEVVLFIETEWGSFDSLVNFSKVVELLPPESFQILYPLDYGLSNVTYSNRSNIPLYVEEYLTSSTITQYQYSLNGGVFQDFTPNTTISVASNGDYNIVVRGNLNGTGTWLYANNNVTFRVEQEDVVINLVEPLNITYSSSLVYPKLEVTNNQSYISDIYFSVDGFPIGGNRTYNNVNTTILGPLSNGSHYIQAFINTDYLKGNYKQSNIVHFTVNIEENFSAVDINGSYPVYNPCVQENDTLTIHVYAYTNLNNNLSGYQVAFFDEVDSVALGTRLTDSNGLASMELNSTVMATLSTGPHKIRVTLYTNPLIINFTYFALERNTSLQGVSISPSVNLTRYMDPANPGTTFTISGSLLDDNLNGVKYAFITVNLDSFTGGTHLRYLFINVKTDSTGHFSWTGTIDTSAPLGNHFLNTSFTGSVEFDGIFFSFTLNTSNALTSVLIRANTSLSVSFSETSGGPPLEIFDTINITGFLRYDNSSGFSGQDINITIEYIIDGSVQKTDYLVATTNSTGEYWKTYMISEASDELRITVEYFPTSSEYIYSTATTSG